MLKTTDNRARRRGQPLTDDQRHRLGSAQDAIYSPSALLNARLAAGLTQIEVAEVLGCSVDLVRRYERGERMPVAQNVLRMMVAYGIGPQELIVGRQ